MKGYSIESYIKNCIYSKKYNTLGNNYQINCNSLYFIEKLNLYLEPFFYSNNEKSKDGICESVFIIIDDQLYTYVMEDNAQAVQKYIRRIEATGTITLSLQGEFKRIHIACEDKNNLGFIQDVYCYIRRSLFYRLKIKNSAILLHASGFFYNGNAILVLGQKGYGKTFISDHFVYNKNAQFVCFDQAIIYLSSKNEIKCRGNITSYRVDITKVPFVQEMETYNKLLKYVQNIEKNKYTLINNKVNIPPAILCELVNRDIKKDITLSKIVVILDESRINNYTVLDEKLKRELIKNHAINDFNDQHELKDRSNEEDCIKRIISDIEFKIVKSRTNIDTIEQML